MAGLGYIIFGIILAIVGYIIRHYIPERIVQIIGLILLVIGLILVIVGAIYLLLGTFDTSGLFILAQPILQ